MLTKNTIKTYLSSPEGRKMVDLFSPTEEDWTDNVEQIIGLIKGYLMGPSAIPFQIQSAGISWNLAWRESGVENIDNVNDFKAIIEHLQLAQWLINPENENEYICYPWHNVGDYRSIALHIPLISLMLWLTLDENSIFYPVLFNTNFADFKDICANAGIELPDTPPQKDKLERCLYYYEICEAIDKFRKDNNLTKTEVCALIYGYLKDENDEIKGEVKAGEELPAPMRIWWAGASKEDYTTSLHEDVSIWQANEQCQRGDIVVVYARSPHSHIHSVWRAVRDAKFEPFDYYCDRIVVSDRIMVSPITIQELKADERTKDWPVVRKQMQGMNQFEVTPQQYATLLNMFKEKGMDVSVLPQLETPSFDDMPEIHIEKDVEEKLLIPLLADLGYSTVEGEDWCRQFNIKLGRKTHGIPDFVFFPKKLDNGGAVAPMLIEAKDDFKNVRQMTKDFNQGASYVRPISAIYMGICDRHQIRIYRKPEKGEWSFDLVPDFQATWSAIKNPEVFNKLKRLIGRDVIAKLAKK